MSQARNILFKGRNIALTYIAPSIGQSTIFWLGGYLSDMNGTKAQFLRNLALKQNMGFVAFDFSYTGASQTQGADLLASEEPFVKVKESFLQASISNWLEESLYIYKNFGGPQTIIIGSSCGAWLALLLTQVLQTSDIGLKTLILLSAAPDFTSNLLYDKMSAAQRESLDKFAYVYFKEGNIFLPFSKNFIEDAKQHYILDKILPINVPIHILHGELDEIVPLPYVLRLLNSLPCSDVSFSCLPNATHNLSRPQDLEKLAQIILT